MTRCFSLGVSLFGTSMLCRTARHIALFCISFNLRATQSSGWEDPRTLPQPMICHVWSPVLYKHVYSRGHAGARTRLLITFAVLHFTWLLAELVGDLRHSARICSSMRLANRIADENLVRLSVFCLLIHGDLIRCGLIRRDVILSYVFFI